jgi:hypothetical protein
VRHARAQPSIETGLPAKRRASKDRIADRCRTDGRFAWLGRVAVWICLGVASVSSLPADEPAAGRAGTEQLREIPLATLPEPPSALAQSIRQWNVKLTTGSRPAEALVNRQGLDAETRYDIAYRYHCRSDWQHDTNRQTVRINMRFSRITWQPTHTIWLRDPPDAARFWDHPLVRHEFDHVLLSSDARMEKRFAELLRSQSEITVSVSEHPVVNRVLIDQLIEEHTQGVFRQVTELINIRYRELDRVTRNGRQPVPEDSHVGQWLAGER